jgi:hypothetical protein
MAQTALLTQGKDLDIQGTLPAPTPTAAQVADQIKTLADLAIAKAAPMGDRGEVIVRADIHEVVTKYGDGTVRTDFLAKKR